MCPDRIVAQDIAALRMLLFVGATLALYTGLGFVWLQGPYAHVYEAVYVPFGLIIYTPVFIRCVVVSRNALEG